MSLDCHKIKSRNSKIYLGYSETNKTINNNKKNSLKGQNSININEKNDDNNSLNYRNNVQLTIGPYVSTLESTQTSQKNQNDENNFFVKNGHSPNISSTSKNNVLSNDEDMIFIYDILFKNKGYYAQQNNNIKINKNEIGYSIKNTNNKIINNIYDFNNIKNYLIKLRKNCKNDENIEYGLKNGIIEINSLNYQLQKLEDLITRYILIIHIFIRSSKYNDAKKLFLLVVKENYNMINNIENQIDLNYSENNRKINISKSIPHPVYKLLKIYSLIIRYSQLFNINKYRNIFISKYLKIQLLNYKYYIWKDIRGFTLEIKNLLSFCLHNVCYYCVQNYMSMNIPIILNSNIISLYKVDNKILTEKEKSLLIKTYYNLGVLYYIDNKLDEALLNLSLSKEKIISLGDDNNKNDEKIKKKDKRENSINLVHLNLKDNDNHDLNNNKNNFRKDNIRKMTNNENSRNILNELFDNIHNYNSSTRKQSTISTDNKIFKNNFLDTKHTKYEKIIGKINEDIRNEKISINNIEFLINFGKENCLLFDDSFWFNNNYNYFGKIKEKFNKTKQSIKGERCSHIDFRTTIKIKNFNIPENYKSPLLRNIESLMCLIELKKKKYEKSYEHSLKMLYLLILLKLSNNNNRYSNNFFNQQKFEIDKYLELIIKSYENHLKFVKIRKKSSSDNMFSIDEIKDHKENNNIENKCINIGSLMPKNKNAINSYLNNFINVQKTESTLKNKENNDNNNNQNINSKVLLEFEKFFIFLSNLSLYQIKILNETQPESDKRNNLPIIFQNQFKDCLSTSQRIELDNLHIMSLNRFIILNDPNKWILPSNLNISLINNNNISKNKRRSYFSSFKRYNYIDENCLKTKEYKYYLKIINSRKCTRDIKDFLVKNKNFILKIIKDINDEEEIKNMIEYPYIIIEPIKTYKRKMKEKLKNLKNFNVKNYLDSLCRRNKNYTRMKTVNINSESMQNEIKRIISNKINKRNKSIVADKPRFQTVIKKIKSKKIINRSIDSYSFDDDLSLSNDY